MTAHWQDSCPGTASCAQAPGAVWELPRWIYFTPMVDAVLLQGEQAVLPPGLLFALHMVGHNLYYLHWELLIGTDTSLCP